MSENIVLTEDRQATYGDGWVDSIAFAADAVLGAIIDVAAVNDVPLPDSQFIYVGDVPKDCEQVAVTASSYAFGRPDDPISGPMADGTCWLPGTVALTAEITRCVPKDNTPQTSSRYGTGVKLPSSVAKEAHAQTVMRDMMILLEAANVAANHPFESSGAEASVLIGNPQGGYQSVFLSISIQV